MVSKKCVYILVLIISCTHVIHVTDELHITASGMDQ